MKKVLVLAKTGMLGCAVYNKFKNSEFEVCGTTRNELDAQLSTEVEIEKVINGFDYVINCIGIIKPYIHDDDTNEVQRAIIVNGLFPHKLASAAQKTATKVIQIATDCVYDGKIGSYSEDDFHNPLDVYGKTKSLGEVKALNVMNLRCSIIGKEEKSYRSLLEWFLSQPKGAKVNGFKNHLWNGVTTNAFADICYGIIKNDFWFQGLQHVIPKDIVSKAEMLHIFAKTFNRADIQITDIHAKESIDRTLKTNNIERNNKLWELAEYKNIPSIEDMIKNIK